MDILQAIESRFQRAIAYSPFLSRELFWLSPLDKELCRETSGVSPTEKDMDQWRNTYPVNP